MIERSPKRIPEWLSLADIARAWSEETGESSEALEDKFRDWFGDYLLRNGYGHPIRHRPCWPRLHDAAAAPKHLIPVPSAGVIGDARVHRRAARR